MSAVSSAGPALTLESFLLLDSAKKASAPGTMLAQAITTPAALAVTSVQLLLVFLTMISSVSLALHDFFLWLLPLSPVGPGPDSRLSWTWPSSAEVEWTPVTESDDGVLAKQRGRVVCTRGRQSISYTAGGAAEADSNSFKEALKFY